MKQFTLTLLAALLYTCSMSAQILQSTIVDEQQLPIPFSNVSLLKADSTFIVGVVTDDNGHFRLPQDAEGKILKVTSLGYQNLAIDCPDVLPDTLTMKADSRTLQTVQVVAQKQLIKSEPDRIGYDIQADPESQTKNVLDMLRKVPLVAVDGQDEITVNGTSAFKIYKNGHPDNALSTNPKEVLKAIPASMIKKIEVITEPGARYDAEGATAILNIVMLDNSSIKGVTATLQARANHYGAFQGGGFLTAQTGKLITSVNYGYVHLNQRAQKQSNESETRYVASGEIDRQQQNSKVAGNVHFANVETSYEIDSLNLLTASVGGYYYTIDINGLNHTARYNAAENLLYSYSSRHYLPSYSYANWDGRIDYEHRTHRKNEVLTASYMLSLTRSKEDVRQEFMDMVNMPVDYTGYTQKDHEQFYEHTFQLDYVYPFSDHHKLDMGLKYINRQNRSQSAMNYDGVDRAMNNNFNHNTQVAAAYLQYMLSLGKFAAQAGLRYEYSYLEAKDKTGGQANYHSNLNDLVPSLNLSYQLTPANSLKLTYSTSINRPGISYLNPARFETIDRITFGNSTLGSSRNQSLGVTFMHIGSKLTYNFRPYFSYVNNGIADLRYVENNIQYRTYGNIQKSHNTGVSTYLQWMPSMATSVMVNASVNYKHLKNPSLGLTTRGWYSNIYANMTQQLPWNLRLTLSGGGIIGHTPGNVYGYSGGFHWYYMSLQRSFLKENRLTVELTGHRIFETNSTWKWYLVQGDTRGWEKGHNSARQIGISVSYRIGRLNASVKKTSATIENSDLEGGIKNNAGGGQ